MWAFSSFVLLAGLPRSDAAAQSQCAVSSQPATWVAARYRGIATTANPSDPDGELDSLRARMGIPLLDSAAVTLVTDTAVCSAALAAYTAHTGLQDIGDSVVVVALGPTRYLVTHALPFDFETKRRIVVFDTTFSTVYFSERW